MRMLGNAKLELHGERPRGTHGDRTETPRKTAWNAQGQDCKRQERTILVERGTQRSTNEGGFLKRHKIPV